MKRRLLTVEAHSRQRREPRRPQPFNQPCRLIGGRIEQQQFMEMRMPAVPPVGCFRGRHRPDEREGGPVTTPPQLLLCPLERVEKGASAVRRSWRAVSVSITTA